MLITGAKNGFNSFNYFADSFDKQNVCFTIMTKISRWVLVWIQCPLFMSGCFSADSAPVIASEQEGITQSATYQISELVRTEFDGEKAFETVAYLDQYIRWPGNAGFDASIDHLVEKLEASGYKREENAPDGARFTYRVEEYPMSSPAWESRSASITLEGQEWSILDFEENRNMLATGSFSTPAGGIAAELVDIGTGSQAEMDVADVRGKIVLARGRISNIFRGAVVERGAIGVLVYSLPNYLQPAKNKHSIQFKRITRNEKVHSWAIALSTHALEQLQTALAAGPVRAVVKTEVRWTDPAIERTVIADIHGASLPDERFVFSAHVQEPGANDNASGVGVQMEMARAAAILVDVGSIRPERSITFLWGDEIRSTARYIEQDAARATGIMWGMSLDMVGEDTDKTGGTFLIEKMPDPSAIWTRGNDEHTEWGSRPLTKDDMVPHYFNDLVFTRALEQAATNDWTVKTNPYEGGSDHVPFLRAGIPGLLLWHFTDQFYHTDRDRLEMVSTEELKNVGVTALVTALALVSADGEMTRALVEEVSMAALSRLEDEAALGAAALADGGALEEQQDILQTWGSWYDNALRAMDDIEVGGSSSETGTAIDRAQRVVAAELKVRLAELNSGR